MEKEIIVASNNKGKLREIQDILRGYKVTSMKDIGIDIDIEENGETFAENALIKARTISKMTGKLCIADDSGLCMEAFDGFPGIKTARFLGENATQTERNEYIVEKVQGLPREKRKAKFVCTIAVVIPEKEEKTFTGELEGYIATKIRAQGGFGMDPIFELADGKTLAEIGTEAKDRISHRYKALVQLREYLENIM
ncbi:MAG: RdgB/HAM1 family non-canonical purine NTP pyrophosphatase [Clostridia bacterium]|jgi:XTP/dITP diphosphohydrolase|nr:RdgB/HAM1 family non-canonical purine NTP pyrophosphatase [Clostridia bacterium]MCI9413178.1 RdgB/HAM1 family non-canonical purine NTP pyrophosphatase [Clostridia bacterium]